MTTTRRTARMTRAAEPAKIAELLNEAATATSPLPTSATNKRGYVAVSLSLSNETNEMLCTARKDTTIEGTNGASVTLSKGEKFYVVRAASLGENMWYIVRLVSGEKKCSCPANKPCKHEVKVAMIEKLKSAKNVQKNQITPLIFSGPALAPQADATKKSDMPEMDPESQSAFRDMLVIRATMMAAPLTGNRGFSLMR